jgi:L-ascorbate peroxidase
MAPNVEQLRAAKQDLAELIKGKSCAPILIRLAWHDSGSFSGQVRWVMEHGGGWLWWRMMMMGDGDDHGL